MTTSVAIQPPATPDPHATPAPNISGDANRATVTPSNEPAPKPEDKLILGKFKDQAALEAAYVELEKKQSTPAPTPEKPAPLPAGVDENALSKELTERGSLSEETLKALEAKGVSRQMATTYVNGLKAQGAQLRSEMAEIVGGEEVLASVLEWATTNLSPEEIAAYNKTFDTNDTATAKLLLSGIATRYTAATGSDPNLVGGSRVTDHSGIKPFESNAQVVEAMRDPRYAKDPAYRKSVEARLAGVSFFNVRDVTRK